MCEQYNNHVIIINNKWYVIIWWLHIYKSKAIILYKLTTYLVNLYIINVVHYSQNILKLNFLGIFSLVYKLNERVIIKKTFRLLKLKMIL